MKKNMKWFIVGFVVACLMITPMVAFADAIQVALNSVNINLNGTQVAAKGQPYTLENGNAVPYSLNYNGTVYLPIRKVSELVGKDISYDSKTSTINIADKAADNKPADPADTTKTDPDTTDSTKQDTTTKPSDKNADSGKVAETKSGFAVINSFYKVLNSSSVQVNQAEGLMDGSYFSMLTSKKDLISFSDQTPALYSITYSNKVITDMSEVSAKVTDTVKTYTENSSLTGSNGTYDLSSDAVCYRITRDGSGSIDTYKLSSGLSLAAGYKVYLYELDSTKGYDVVIYEK